MVNGIVLNRIDYLYKNWFFSLNNLQRLICYKNQPTNQPINYQSVYLSLFIVVASYICMYLSNLSVRAASDTRSIFKRCLTGLNSRFSFSSIGCHYKTKKLRPPYYLPIAREKIFGWMELALWNVNSFVSDLNSDRRVNFLRR